MQARPTLRIIQDVHSVLAAMLRTIGLLLSESRRRGTSPDLAMLRAMLFYVDEFPERLHHTEESQAAVSAYPRTRRWRAGRTAR